MPVSMPNSSPARMILSEVSWPQGLVRPPEPAKTVLDPFAAGSRVYVMQVGPESLIADPRPQLLADLRKRSLGDGRRCRQAEDLVLVLDRRRPLDQGVALHHVEARLGEGEGDVWLGDVEGDAPVAAPGICHLVGDLPGPGLRPRPRRDRPRTNRMRPARRGGRRPCRAWRAVL